MLSSIEMDYVKGVLNAYYAKGYKYYLIHTVTEPDNNYDIHIYLSKEEIVAMNDNYFFVNHGLELLIDSSLRSYNSSIARDSVSNFSGNVTVNQAEFIYTNAESRYNLTTLSLNPNITVDYTESATSVILIIVVCILLLYLFIRDLFNIGGSHA